MYKLLSIGFTGLIAMQAIVGTIGNAFEGASEAVQSNRAERLEQIR